MWSIGYSLDFKTSFFSLSFYEVLWKVPSLYVYKFSSQFFVKPTQTFTQIFSAKFAANYTTLENRCLPKDQRTLPIVFNHFNQVLSCLTEIKLTKNGFLPIQQGKKTTNQKRLVPNTSKRTRPKWNCYCLISHRAGAWHYRIFLTNALFTWAWLTGLSYRDEFRLGFIWEILSRFPRCEKAKDPGDEF